MKMKVLAALLAVSAAMHAFAGVTPNVWGSDYLAGKKYAESNGLPMFAYWGSALCSKCSAATAVLKGDTATSRWLASHKMVLVYIHDDDTQKNYLMNSSGLRPYLQFHWVKNGKTLVSQKFTGRAGNETAHTLPGHLPYETGDLDEQLSRFLETLYAAACFDPFVITPSEGHRLEAQVGSTKYVDVPLRRADNLDMPAVTNVLTWTYGDNVRSTNVIWQANVSNLSVRVDTDFPEAKAGDSVILQLAKDDTVAESSIAFVDLVNSPANPLWKAERTVATLGYGEWTCDLDTATNKVAAAKAHGTSAWTLVYSHGSQWCPYCYLNGPSFVETEAFHQWATNNNVVLVSADMPHCSDKNPDQDWCTIWHTTPEETDLYFDGKGAIPRSGAGYLSRKMISEGEAAAMRAQLKELNRSFLHLPEDYQASRAIIPGMTLVNADGRVVGRLETFDYNMNNHTDGALAGVYCRRLSEMIAAAASTASETSEDRESENLNDNCATTPLALFLSTSGSVATGTVSHADYRDVYRLLNVTPGQQAVLRVRGVRDDNIRLCLLKGDRDGNVTDMIKTVTGKLTDGVSIDTSELENFAFDPGNSTYFVRVSCHDIMPTSSGNYRPYRLRWGDNSDDATFDGYSAACEGDTLTGYELSAACLFVPSEIESSYVATSGEILTFFVTEGEDYKFSGVNPPSDWFTCQGGIYRARQTGYVDMAEVGAAPVEVTYQLWHPGEIAFGEDGQFVLERDGRGTVTVERNNGASDACVVKVRVRPGSETNVVGRYVFTETNLVWQSGESDVKTVAFELVDNESYDNEGSFIVELVKGTPCSAAVSDAGEEIVIADTTSPVFRKSHYNVSVYAGFACADTFEACNIASRGTVKLTAVTGSDKLPNGLKLAYDKKTGVVALTGTAKTKSIGTYEMSYTLTQNRDTGYPSTFTVTVKDPAEFNAFVGVKRASQVMPLFEETDGTNYVCGLLTVSITANNKITAKYVSATEKASFSGGWSSVNEETGVVSTSLSSRGGELLLEMDTEGTITARLNDEFAGEVPYPVEGVFSAWSGSYTVALPCVDDGEGGASAGSAYLTLAMTSSSAVRKGLVTVAGMLPNGKKVSGSATLVPADDRMLLPIYLYSSKNELGVVLALDPDGAVKWDSQEDVAEREVVHLADNYGAYCHLTGKNIEQTTLHGAAGSWYPTSKTPGELAATFYGDATQVFDLSVINGAQTNVIGQVVADGKKLVLVEKVSGVTISFTKKSGVFTGKALGGNYAGVLVPGWHKNCSCGDNGVEFPFGAGSLYLKSGESLPIVLDESKEDQ